MCLIAGACVCTYPNYASDILHSCLDELAYLIEDQEEHGQTARPARRTRGVKIDFTGKDDGPEEDEEEGEENETDAPIEGKGKGKAVPTTLGQGSPIKPPSNAKPASTASNKDA